MKNKAELEAKHPKELADLETEESIRAILPKQYQENAMICLHGGFASVKMWTDFRTEHKLSDAIEIVNLFASNIVECGHWKDGCISTWPDAINTNINKERAIMDGSHAVEIEVCGGKGYGPYTVVSFWVDMPKLGLIEIHCPVCDLWKLVPHVKATYNNSGELASCRIDWPAERACVDSFRAFWSDKPAFQGSYYLADLPNFLSWAGSINTPKLVNN